MVYPSSLSSNRFSSIEVKNENTEDDAERKMARLSINSDRRTRSREPSESRQRSFSGNRGCGKDAYRSRNPSPYYGYKTCHEEKENQNRHNAVKRFVEGRNGRSPYGRSQGD